LIVEWSWISFLVFCIMPSDIIVAASTLLFVVSGVCQICSWPFVVIRLYNIANAIINFIMNSSLVSFCSLILILSKAFQLHVGCLRVNAWIMYTISVKSKINYYSHSMWRLHSECYSECVD
jgi:hypothetical protein